MFWEWGVIEGFIDGFGSKIWFFGLFYDDADGGVFPERDFDDLTDL